MSADDIRKKNYTYEEDEEYDEDDFEDSEPPRTRSRRKKKKHSGCLISILVFLTIVVVAVLFAFYEYNHIYNFDEAVDPESEEVIEFTVKSGNITKQIAEKLEREGLIEDQKIFVYKSKLHEFDNKYKAGTYKLSPSMTMEEIMAALQEGTKREAVRFTIPEGLNLVQVGEKLEEQGICSAADFYRALEESYDYDFLEPAQEEAPSDLISLRANRLEGLLYPDTYEVYTDAKPEEIIDKMLAQFEKKYDEEIREGAAALGLSMHDVCVIASLIERECRVDEERPVVASVIFNRLEIGMKLQLDCTVQYAQGENKERLTLKDTEITSPYNTYQIPALPAGPISNFGYASLHAAVNPANTEYLYYVARNDGTNKHNFAVTYGEFSEYKEQYLNTLD